MAEEPIMAVPQAPQPEAPTKPTVDEAALHAYFESIRDSFTETRKGEEEDNESPHWVFVFFFLLSLIPLFAFLASRLTNHYFGNAIFTIKGLRFHVGSFWFWWVALFLLSLGILLLAIKFSGVSSAEKKKWLSPTQMRFAFSYAVVEQIQKFRTNQMARHIDEAILCLDRTSAMLLTRRAMPAEFYLGPTFPRDSAESEGPPKW